MVFTGEAINKAKFVQATHYVVDRLQSARFIVLIPFLFLASLAPLSTNNVFLFRSLPKILLPLFDKLTLGNGCACFHFDVVSLLEEFSFKFEPHISSRHHICIFDISQDLGIFFDLGFPIPSYLFSKTTVST